ncbi:unnamed protein product [Pelagomonas calceolata]|uniref:Uncharacterized protein n=1 Tax=Pelagomonas calceolata TaxID=35677 RepID=A0A8J2WZA6_9STRA|nr:unnamed protein product [Pelagomonas calceolata]
MPSLTKVLLALSLASTDAWFQKTFCSYFEERANKCMCQNLPQAIALEFGDSTENLETNTQWLVQPEQILTYPCSTGYLGTSSAEINMIGQLDVTRESSLDHDSRTGNAAANYELEHDIQDAITDLGESLIDSVKCGVKCDINNNAVASGTLDTGIYESNNANSILEANRWGWPIYNHEEIEYLCGAHPGVGPQSERTGALDKWWIDKGFGELVDGLSACDCKTDVTFGDGSIGSIATGCYRCAGTITYGITESTGCYVSDSDVGH